jgi:putative MATE family efflux protein
MTEGNPLAVMLRFSLPLLIGNIAQLLYNTVNAIIVGNLVGPNALSSVSVSTPIQNIFFTFFMTVGTGVSIVVAQYFGAKDREKVSLSVGNAITLALIATLSISLIGVPLAGSLLRLNKVNATILPDARTYLMIMFAGAIGVGFYNILSGILRGLGDSVFPLRVLVGTSLLNIGLVYLFVGVFELGVAGAAIATVTAQTLSAAVCLYKIMRMKSVLDLNRDVLRPRKYMVWHILRIGLPSGVQQVILGSSAFIVNGLVNGILVLDANRLVSDTIFVSAAAAFTQTDAIANLPSQAFSMGGSTFAGQNIGAGRLDRVKQGFKIISVMCLAMSAIIFTVIYIWGGELIKLFVKADDPDYGKIVEWGKWIQRIYVYTYIEMAILQPASGVLRGAGDTMPVMWITIFCTVVLRIPMAWLWVTQSGDQSMGGNASGIYWSMVICFGIAAALSLGYYLSGRWKRKILVRSPTTGDAE